LAVAAIFPLNAAAFETSGDVYVGVADKYVWRGIELSDRKPVLQGGMDISVGNLTFGYWTNMQMVSGDGDALKSGEVTETDIVIDYSTTVADIIGVSIGNINYSFNVPGNTNEFYLGLSADVLLAPTLTAYWDWDAADSDGLFYTLDISHSFELLENLSAGVSGLVSYNQASPFVGSYRDLHDYELGASLDYAINDSFGVGAAYTFSEGISDDARMVIDSQNLFAATLTYSF